MGIEITEVISVSLGVAGLGFGLVKDFGEKRVRGEVKRFKERAQAERVSAWAGKRTDEGRRVFVHNASEQIVRDVRAWLVTPIPQSPAEDALPDRAPATQRAVLEPGGTLEHLISASSMRGPAPIKRPSVILAFGDADGRQWIRTDDSRLLRKDSSAR